MNPRTLSFFACAAVLGLASLQATSGCSSSSSTGAGGGGGAAADPCFDYAGYDGTTPSVSFKNDVEPIFRRACGLSDSCHGNPLATIPNQPYLGPKTSDPAPSDADLANIVDHVVNVIGQVPTSNGGSTPITGGMVIVKPSDPANSFMMAKLDAIPAGNLFCSTYACAADASCGVSMPSGGPQLEPDELTVIRDWIAQGANKN